jgi:hypothetical protein
LERITLSSFSNELSFSFSRLGTFESCKRKYYLNYYASRNGWLKRAPEHTKEIYFLKRLTGIYAWVGTLVHEEIARILHIFKKTKKILSPQKARDHMFDRMKSEWSESKDRVTSRIAKQFGLKEHEYGYDMSKDKRMSLRDRAFACLSNFYKSAAFEEIFDVPVEDWLYIDDNSFNKFPVLLSDGTQIQCFSIPDFAMRKPNGIVTIYDWKTGKPDGRYKTQAAMYSLYASEYWNVAPDMIETVLVYLKDNEETRGMVNQETIDDIKERINDGVCAMTDLLEDGDRYRNKAIKIVGTQSVDLDKFPLPETKSECFFCTFEKVCGIKSKQQ